MSTWQRRTGIQLCYPFEQKRLAKWVAPYIVQPKLDGDRCRALLSPQEPVLMFSSEEHLILSVPHIMTDLTILAQRLGTPIELDGELYIHRTAHQHIHGIVSRTVNIHPDFDTMQYHIFDIVSDLPQLERLGQLVKLYDMIQDLPSLRIVQTDIADNFNDFLHAYEEYTSCLLYTSPSPRDTERSRMPSSA